MSDDTLIRVEGVSKKFCLSLKKSLWYGLCDMGREFTGRQHGAATPADKRQTKGQKHQTENPQSSVSSCGLRPEEFWAVNDVSFELKRGECMGLIGRNGAGKTTLLKMLNGLIKPDRGRIELRGSVGGLIALGAGFNPILTGRENIFVNGSVLGLSTREINAKLDEIIDFAEIHDFIDTPVQNYSSGMAVRLGFAVAAVLTKPDILLLDEVLAVGDLGFRYRCFRRVGQIMKNAAVIFVSHDMPSVTRLATRIMLMNHGTVDTLGNDNASVVQRYFAMLPGGESFVEGTGDAAVSNVMVYPEDNPQRLQEVDYGKNAVISFEVDFLTQVPEASLTINILDKTSTAIAQMEAINLGFKIRNTGRKQRIEALVRDLPLSPGDYALWIIINGIKEMRPMAVHYGVAPFSVKGGFVGYIPVQPIPVWSAVSL